MTLNTLELPIPERVPAELLLCHSVPAKDWKLATPQPILRLAGMSPYRPTRREFLIGAGSLLILAPYGCGGEGHGESASGETRTIEDPTGRRVEVPVRPERVIALDPSWAVFYLAEVGLVPVGATTDTTTVGGNFPTLLDEVKQGAREEIRPVGDSFSPDLERIAALEPDLILHQAEYSDPGIERLSEIAPTVQYDQSALGPDPTKWMRFFADAVNRRERGEEAIRRFEAQLEETAERLDVGGQTCSVVLLYAFEPSFDLYGPEDTSGHIAERLGWRVVPEEVGGEPLDDYVEGISLEQIGDLIDADTVLFLRYAGGLTSGEVPSGENFDSVTQSAVWQKAVEGENLVTLDALNATGSYGFVGLEETLYRLVGQL